jgi:hypothetical protein
MEDRNIDIMISLLPPAVPLQFLTTNMTAEQKQMLQAENRKNLDFLNQLVRQQDKPLVLIKRLNPQIGHDSLDSAFTPEFRIPEYYSARRAARTLRLLAWYRRYLEDRKGASPF